MAFLSFLFGKKAPKPEDDKDIAEHLDFINSLRLPAIMMSQSEGQPFSRIGGLPCMPDDLAWPEWKGKPLAFLCQLDLSEIPQEFPRQGLPESGLLFFFYNQEQETWGFDPKDKGSWRVLYSARPASDCVEREPPKQLKDKCIYGEKPIAFSIIQTYPSWPDERISALNLTDEPFDQYSVICDSVYQNKPAHQLLGYPSPVQYNDMDLECQLASNGIYCGDEKGYKDPEAKELEKGRKDWVLLFQFDSDDDIDVMWGDCGMLYFWIKKDDLAAKRFENCWMILQCF